MLGTICHHTISLDGYIAAPDDSMEWAFRHGLRASEKEIESREPEGPHDSTRHQHRQLERADAATSSVAPNPDTL